MLLRLAVFLPVTNWMLHIINKCTEYHAKHILQGLTNLKNLTKNLLLELKLPLTIKGEGL